jgi:FAD/FMN-containing dehydrogenase
VLDRLGPAAGEAFDTARRPWNLAIDQRVAAVVDAADANDVATVVRYAGLNGLAITTQPSGHGASGNADDVILLRTGRLDELTVHPRQRWARVGAGVRRGPVLAETSPHGLIGLAGSSPVVSVTGYTLGGGLSWFSRKYGFASDSVRAFDVVTTDGTLTRASEVCNPELFWALRGGGGDFAIVTALEFDLHHAPHLYGGRMTWPSSHLDEVLAAFEEVTAADAPDALTVWFEALPGMSAVVVDATFLGPAEEGAVLLRRFGKIPGRLSDTRGPLPIADLGTITAEPTAPSAGTSRAELLDSPVFPAELAPLLAVQLRHLGGALSQPGTGASGHLDEQYLLYMFGLPGIPGTAERQESIATALTPHTSGRKPFNFLRPAERAANAFPQSTLTRLRAAKHAWDPQDILRSNYPVQQ